MVKFDVNFLFPSVPLEHTIDTFTKYEMKKLFTICTKNVYFSLKNDICVQIGGVPVGSILGLVIANILW